jgi:hypothetical protein
MENGENKDVLGFTIGFQLVSKHRDVGLLEKNYLDWHSFSI